MRIYFLALEEDHQNEWMDLNFFNHQLVLHKAQANSEDSAVNFVDGDNIPCSSFWSDS
jgi:extradiol dioxygenase family protein